MAIRFVEKAMSLVREKIHPKPAQEAEATRARLEKLRAIRNEQSPKAPVPTPSAEIPATATTPPTEATSGNGEAIGALLARRSAIEMFLNSADSTGSSKASDVAQLEKIEKSLKELGYNSPEDKKAA